MNRRLEVFPSRPHTEGSLNTCYQYLRKRRFSRIQTVNDTSHRNIEGKTDTEKAAKMITIVDSPPKKPIEGAAWVRTESKWFFCSHWRGCGVSVITPQWPKSCILHLKIYILDVKWKDHEVYPLFLRGQIWTPLAKSSTLEVHFIKYADVKMWINP